MIWQIILNKEAILLESFIQIFGIADNIFLSEFSAISKSNLLVPNLHKYFG